MIMTTTRTGFPRAALLVAWSGFFAISCAGELTLRAADEKTLVQQGQEAWNKNDYDEAIAAYNQALLLDPKDADAYTGRGNCYLIKKDYDKAVADYDQALLIDPKNKTAQLNRGAAYFETGNFDEALANYRRVIQIYPTEWLSYEISAKIWATCPEAKIRDGKKAVEYATKACELTYWEHPLALSTLAAAYAEAGDFDNAIKWENSALKSSISLKLDVFADAPSRLALYHAHQPYHESK